MEMSTRSVSSVTPGSSCARMEKSSDASRLYIPAATASGAKLKSASSREGASRRRVRACGSVMNTGPAMTVPPDTRVRVRVISGRGMLGSGEGKGDGVGPPVGDGVAVGSGGVGVAVGAAVKAASMVWFAVTLGNV